MVVELSNELCERGYEVVLCSFKEVTGDMTFPRELRPQVKLVSFDKKPGIQPGVYLNLVQLIRREKPGVIHFHLDATLKYLLPLIPLFPRITFVHTIHSDLNPEKLKIFTQLKRVKFLLRRVKLVCISKDIHAAFSQRFPEFLYLMVENGIADLKTTDGFNDVKRKLDGLRQPGDRLVLVAVGRLDENKNQELMIRAFLASHCENAVLLILGKDPSPGQVYFKKLEALVNEQVLLLGAKNNVADYLRCADAFVMTSLNEGLPISALEAFAAGVPVLTTPAGGMVTLVTDGEQGIVAADFSAQSMTSAFSRFFQLNHNQQKAIGERNRELFLSRYTIAHCASAYQAIYSS